MLGSFVDEILTIARGESQDSAQVNAVTAVHFIRRKARLQQGSERYSKKGGLHSVLWI